MIRALPIYHLSSPVIATFADVIRKKIEYHTCLFQSQIRGKYVEINIVLSWLILCGNIRKCSLPQILPRTET